MTAAGPPPLYDGPPLTLRVVYADEIEPRCRCGHHRDVHGIDRKRRPVCRGNAMCGCGSYRQPMPEGWDR